MTPRTCCCDNFYEVEHFYKILLYNLQVCTRVHQVYKFKYKSKYFWEQLRIIQLPWVFNHFSFKYSILIPVPGLFFSIIHTQRLSYEL
jgi:hypothetical protein